MACYISNVLSQKPFGRKCDVIPFRLSSVIELFASQNNLSAGIDQYFQNYGKVEVNIEH